MTNTVQRARATQVCRYGANKMMNRTLSDRFQGSRMAAVPNRVEESAMTNTVRERVDATIERRERFMTQNYPRWGITVVEGSGCEFTDSTGTTYLDLFAGTGATILGHCHPELVAAATEQAGKLWHVGNLLDNEPQSLLAEAIARHGFGGRSCFGHSGSIELIGTASGLMPTPRSVHRSCR